MSAWAISQAVLNHDGPRQVPGRVERLGDKVMTGHEDGNTETEVWAAQSCQQLIGVRQARQEERHKARHSSVWLEGTRSHISGHIDLQLLMPQRLERISDGPRPRRNEPRSH
jgi:hypothetical protein